MIVDEFQHDAKDAEITSLRTRLDAEHAAHKETRERLAQAADALGEIATMCEDKMAFYLPLKERESVRRFLDPIHDAARDARLAALLEKKGGAKP